MGSDFFMEEVAKMEEKTDIKAKTITVDISSLTPYPLKNSILVFTLDGIYNL